MNRCWKNNNRCKKLKFKIIKREKKRKKEKKKENSPELQKPNVEGEAYNNNFKMWLRKKAQKLN